MFSNAPGKVILHKPVWWQHPVNHVQYPVNSHVWAASDLRKTLAVFFILPKISLDGLEVLQEDCLVNSSLPLKYCSRHCEESPATSTQPLLLRNSRLSASVCYGLLCVGWNNCFTKLPFLLLKRFLAAKFSPSKDQKTSVTEIANLLEQSWVHFILPI